MDNTLAVHNTLKVLESSLPFRPMKHKIFPRSHNPYNGKTSVLKVCFGPHHKYYITVTNITFETPSSCLL